MERPAEFLDTHSRIHVRDKQELVLITIEAPVWAAIMDITRDATSSLIATTPILFAPQQARVITHLASLLHSHLHSIHSSYAPP